MAAGGATCEEYYLFEDYEHTLEYGDVPAEIAEALAAQRAPLPDRGFARRAVPERIAPAELAAHRAQQPPVWSAEYVAHTTPERWFTNRGCAVDVTVRNTSAATWGTSGETVGRIVLSYRWRDLGGQLVIPQGDIALLPRPAAPGDQLEITAGLWTPAEPGRYVLEWEMLCEGVAWFSDHGAPPLAVTVDVEDLGTRPPAPHFPGQEPAPEPERARTPVLRWLAR
jgi:hypothetical protein